MALASSSAPQRFDLDGTLIQPLTICMIGAGGFIGSHLCEKLMWETEHTILAIDVYSDKIQHLLEPAQPWSSRIEFHRLNIKNDSRLEGLIKTSDLVQSKQYNAETTSFSATSFHSAARRIVVYLYVWLWLFLCKFCI